MWHFKDLWRQRSTPVYSSSTTEEAAYGNSASPLGCVIYSLRSPQVKRGFQSAVKFDVRMWQFWLPSDWAGAFITWGAIFFCQGSLQHFTLLFLWSETSAVAAGAAHFCCVALNAKGDLCQTGPSWYDRCALMEEDTQNTVTSSDVNKD